MRQELKKQKTLSALVAFGLAAVITLFAASNSFGVPSHEDISDIDARIDMELLAEAVAEIKKDMYTFDMDETFNLHIEDVKNIKVFNAENKLVGQVSLKGNQVIEDKDIQVLVNRSEFLSSYGNTSIYRISE
ncbi:hypothetical protein [Roseivirga echinicomitans]|uniref:Uncharacterized protein n=1 Tax=Roseivirga echinicomitans TaxID=296218 RepID=A0A150XSW2_9BACT|nr:hypothetical protein [Roseivirga echinicomitans]KYG81776.1 hypothetical protein AWN68_16225 [Roseivirga echinicomitans]